MSSHDNAAILSVHRAEASTLRLDIQGDWLEAPGLPSIDTLERELSGGQPARILEFNTTRLGRWNSGFLAFVLQCYDLCVRRGIDFRVDTLPEGVRRLLRLAQAAPDRAGALPPEAAPLWLHRVGQSAGDSWQSVLSTLAFLGETVMAGGRMVCGRARFRWAETLPLMQECGPRALPIVGLINFLVGLILAFVGAVQLSRFGASVYVADLVAIGAVREMGALMTAIIVCGRTGAAFAAELGTMKVNEEIDAFRTFGVSTTEYLVLPRLAALVLMIPVLCVFADLIAIAGGMTVSALMLDVDATQYLSRTLHVVTLTSFFIGLVKGAVFGFLVAFAGCFHGVHCADTAAAVGRAATAAVVTGITAIIAADGLFAVLCHALGL